MKNNLLDRAENALLEILRREITGLDGTEKLGLSVAGQSAVMRLAKEHAVTGLVANAVVRNRIVIAGGGEVVMRLMQQTMAHRQTMQRFENGVGRFARLMKENGIAYVVFKGLAVARHYPEPFVRTMGDVDMMGYKNAFKAMLAMMRKHFGVATADTLCSLNARDERFGDKLLEAVMESGNFGRKAYKAQTSGRKRSMETAQRALAHCIKFFWLAPIDILCLVPKRIGISVKQKI